MNNLLEKYPYATEAIRDWFMGKMIESFKDENVPNDFKEFMRQQGIPNDRLAQMIEGNPRVLFDIFDDNQVIINVLHMYNGFVWDIGDVKGIQVCSCRKDAEKAAVERAFQILDEKLNIIISETKNDEGPDSGTSDSKVF
jgi:hypothetical protein